MCACPGVGRHLRSLVPRSRERLAPHFTGRSQGPERALSLPTSRGLSGVGGRAEQAWGGFSFLGTEAGRGGRASRPFLQPRHGHGRTRAHSRDSGLLLLGALASAPGPPSLRKIPSETGKLAPHQGKRNFPGPPTAVLSRTGGPAPPGQEVPWPPAAPKIVRSAQQALPSSPKGPAPSRQNPGRAGPLSVGDLGFRLTTRACWWRGGEGIRLTCRLTLHRRPSVSAQSPGPTGKQSK